MLKGQSSYHRLDFHPKTEKIPDGTVIKKGEVVQKGPRKLFYEIDLYTTKYFGIDNDDIETHLFGKIDTIGSRALPVLASDNWMRKLHPHVLNFFEYMDAQKLRTPRGLNWLINTLKPKDYNTLLHEMQTVRQMNCTMWAEAVMEVVSAEDSDIKFIVSDTPITTYNPACYPKSKYCEFPNDPGIELMGTRTIFPIDLNHCVILTNTEYARNPGKLKALKSRTNARYFDDTIVKYDDIIRGRKLDTQSVLGINYILKSRASRYIAAAQKEWLFPEKQLNSTDWEKLDKILISREFRSIGHDRGIIIVGDGGKLIATQDEFGRKPKNQQEWDAKELQAKEMRDQLFKLLEKEKNKSKKNKGVSMN